MAREFNRWKFLDEVRHEAGAKKINGQYTPLFYEFTDKYGNKSYCTPHRGFIDGNAYEFDELDCVKSQSETFNVFSDNTLDNYRTLCEIDKDKFEECLKVDNKGKRGENLIPYVIEVKGTPVTNSYVVFNPRYLRDAIKWCNEYCLYWNGMTSYPFYIMSYNGREYDKKAIILPIRLTDNAIAKAKIYQEVQL